MNLQNKSVEVIVQQLLDYSITPYEVIKLLRKDYSYMIPSIRNLVTTHDSPYIRLCAAWSLGEIGDKDSISMLKEAYKKENEDNVRTNIVWALFMIDPHQIDQLLFQTFVNDNYFLIPLVALKRISGMPKLQGVIDFWTIYEKSENILLKLEILRNIRCLRYPNDINKRLKKELYSSKNPHIKMGIIKAIGATNQIDSVDILIQYYNDSRSEILQSDLLAFEYVSAMQSLAQSKPYESLQEIYFHFQSGLIRWKIIETLATAGGPKCVEVLKVIHDKEKDLQLKEQIQKFIDIILITIK